MASRKSPDLELCAAWSTAVLAIAAMYLASILWLHVDGRISDTDLALNVGFGVLASFFASLIVEVARDLEMRRTRVAARALHWVVCLETMTPLIIHLSAR